jgi:choline transport protein
MSPTMRMNSDEKNVSIALTEYPQDGSPAEPKALDDGRDMRELGRPQQLHRQFKTRSLVGFTVTLGATWPYAIVSTPISLANGGPAGAIWMFVLTAIGFGSVVTSLAHAASMQPYSGGPYHWVSVFARKRHQKLLSYIVGWFEVIGWIAGTAATAYFVGGIFLSQIALFHPDYVILPWHSTLACIGVTFLAVVFNYFIKAVRFLEGLVLFFNIGAFLCYLVVLLALGPQKDVAATFFDIQDTQGWGSKGTAALVGLLGPIITLIGADSTSHLAEETVGARKIVPRAMFISVAISYSFGFIMTVVIMVVSTGYSENLATQTGNAGVAIIYNATRSLPATQAMTIVLFLLLFWGLTNQVTGASRVTWAFARDGGLPGYTWLARVSL